MSGDSKKNHSQSIVKEMRLLEKNGLLYKKNKHFSSSSSKKTHLPYVIKDLESIFENLQEGIILKDEDNDTIIYVNRKAAELLDYPKQKIIGKKCEQFIHLPKNNRNVKNTNGKLVQHELSSKNKKIPILRNSSLINLNETTYVLENFVSINLIENKKNEEIKRKEQLLAYQKILLDLSKKQFRSFKDALKYVNEKVAETLEIERCGFWLFNDDHSQIICKDVYLKNKNEHEQGSVLNANQYPHYFEALEKELVIDASDAINDPRTKEFEVSYLKPLNIVSMLDFPVRLHGQVIGIICCEQSKEKRIWTDNEKSFVKSISDFVSLQFEKQNRLSLERQLKESKKQADAILEAAADGIRIIDKNFKIISANKTMKKLSRSDDSEIVGKYCFDTLSSKFCGTKNCSLKKVLSARKGFIRESSRKSAEDKQVDCIEVVKPYKDDDGNIIGIIEDIRDISYLKKTQHELIKEKKKAQEYLDVATVIIIVLDAKGNLVLINKKGCNTLGYDEEELIGKNWFDLISPMEIARKQKILFNQYIKGDISFPENDFNEVVTKDGEKRIIKWNTTKVYDESRKQVSILSSGEDITEETRAKEAKRKADAILEKRNKAFRLLYDTALKVENQPKYKVISLLCKNLTKIANAQDSILGLYNPKKNSFMFYGIDSTKNENQVFEQKNNMQNETMDWIQNVSNSEVIKYDKIPDTLTNILPSKVLKKFCRNHNTIFQLSKPLDNNSFIISLIIKKNDEKLDLKDMIDTFLNFSGIILQRIQSLEELAASEQRYKKLSNELEEKVEHRTNHIQKLLKQKDAFINQLGHDLKHPINPLLNLLPILEKKNSDPACQEIIDVMKRNTGYMKNLIIKTIKFAQLNAPSTEFSIEKVHLYDEINQILEKQKISFQQKNISVSNNIDKTIVLPVDKLYFSELIDNLLNNAVKYNSKHGKIIINGSVHDDMVLISIKDSGIGMSSDQLDHIFEEFYKADPARHDFDSSGLGMSICKRIVEKHNGRIWVESEGVGKGTTVNISLPLHQS